MKIKTLTQTKSTKEKKPRGFTKCWKARKVCLVCKRVFYAVTYSGALYCDNCRTKTKNKNG